MKGWKRKKRRGESEAEGERGADKSNRPFAVEPLGASGQQIDTLRELKPLHCRLEGQRDNTRSLWPTN